MDGSLTVPADIELDQVQVEYPGPVRALGPLSLTIPAGSFTALVGPSGSGKTTLLNLIGGLDHPTSGKVRVAGRCLGSLNDQELSAYRSRSIGFVFQSFHLHPERTAMQNLCVPLYFTDLPMPEGKARARHLLHRLGLEGMEHRPVSRLSGGQRQRVALARALMNSPRVLLADEPIGNLDQVSAEGVLELMLELHREESLTVVTATHDDLLMNRANRVLHMEAGSLKEPA